MKFVFLGPPGAGKGTQAKILSSKLKIPHISTGDIFRDNIKNKTELGKKASQFSDKGLLVPDEVTNAMVQERLMRKDCSDGYILDGYPRTIPQAKFLDKIEDIDFAVYFFLDDKTSIDRMLNRAKDSDRADDNEEVIKKRIKVYRKQTKPLVEYYRDKKKLIEIDAKPSIEKISETVEKNLL